MRHVPCLPGIVAALLLMPALAGAQEVSPFVPEDLWSLQQVQNPEISPDGKQIAFVRAYFDRMSDEEKSSLWLTGSNGAAPVPVVEEGGDPAWSPGGEQLAYVARDGDGHPQIYVRWMEQKVATRVTQLPKAPMSLSWSPDGTEIAFLSMVTSPEPTLGTPLAKPDGAHWPEPARLVDRLVFERDGSGFAPSGYIQLFKVDVASRTVTQLTREDMNVQPGLVWGKDGKSLIYSAQKVAETAEEREDTNLFQIASDGGKPKQLTTNTGPDGDPALSPDGKKVAYLTHPSRQGFLTVNEISILDLASGAITPVPTTLDRSFADLVWAKDGRIYASFADHGDARVARIGLDGKVTVLASGASGGDIDRPYVGPSRFSVSADGSTIAVLHSQWLRPAELAILKAGTLKQLTHLNDSLLSRRKLGQITPFTVKSSADGLPIDAWVVTPPDYVQNQRYPLILEIHGGPTSAYGSVWSAMDQLYAAAGYVVVYANPRGSDTYGTKFANEINDAYPGKDYDDLMSVVDAVIAKGIADPARLFVTGGSGGGVLTAWIVGKTHRFKAAVSQKPVIDWTSEALVADIPWVEIYNWFGHEPWDKPEDYWAHSPLSLVGNVTTPTLLTVGELDHRTPPEEAIQFYRALRLRRVPTGLLTVPGAAHGSFVARPSSLASVTSAILTWFGRYGGVEQSKSAARSP